MSLVLRVSEGDSRGHWKNPEFTEYLIGIIITSYAYAQLYQTAATIMRQEEVEGLWKRISQKNFVMFSESDQGLKKLLGRILAN